MGAGGHKSGDILTEKTAVLGLRLYVLLALAVAALLTGVLMALLLFLRSTSRRHKMTRLKHSSGLSPAFSLEIGDIGLDGTGSIGGKGFEGSEKKGTQVVVGECSRSKAGAEMIAQIGWGRWFTFAELDAATSGFADWNVIGEGGYGVVYRGVLPDLSVVAVKNLLNKKGQAEKEFKVEVEAIGRVRHKNLVGLVGYCAEGPKRMLVYEYMDNGNLEQWLHGNVGPVSPLTWEVRMKIAIGTAKGLAHLHEGLEPKVVHRDIKSSNILLDKQWNPKVSDFGLAKLLGPGSNFVTTRVMGTFGYVAPEYASTGLLNESSDVYSFGVLLMEIISGRNPVDYRRPAGEVNLVEWFRGMVGTKHVEDVIDPSIEIQPSPRGLKRTLLVCLRCVDLDSQKRPKMGQVAHMLEGDEFPFRLEHRSPREVSLLTCLPASVAPARVPLLTDKVSLSPSERSMWR
ncbi:probable receptor-like serine/threonine-protein kinase At4g34500 [Phalaenopsis equestris]|uniref:probable receptor-like serine/threonine-protein kinase At4g34500 n=1 Tax=Phalaenopsis equestris TaxID=78828 RepID=UPI0009E2E138|nr:probable receptor-like serine/threonine-protein kinase At4g34500 [Phalaenopsis equestris]